jgi:hypothetical protein
MTPAASVSDAQTVASLIDDARVIIYNCNMLKIHSAVGVTKPFYFVPIIS